MEPFLLNAEIAERHRKAAAAALARRARKANRPQTEKTGKHADYYVPPTGLDARERAHLRAYSHRFGSTI